MTRVIRLHAVANGHTLRFYGLDQRRRCVLGPLPPSLTRKQIMPNKGGRPELTQGGAPPSLTRKQARAIRRAGELLKQIIPATGAHLKSAATDTLSRKLAGMPKASC